MRKSAAQWKEFKADLKKDFLQKYNDEMDEDELLALRDERVHEDDWMWLLDHWRSAEAIVRNKFPYFLVLWTLRLYIYIADRLVH